MVRRQYSVPPPLHTHTPQGTVDYIFFRPGRVRCTGVAEMLSPGPLLRAGAQGERKMAGFNIWSRAIIVLLGDPSSAAAQPNWLAQHWCRSTRCAVPLVVFYRRLVCICCLLYSSLRACLCTKHCHRLMHLPDYTKFTHLPVQYCILPFCA